MKRLSIFISLTASLVAAGCGSGDKDEVPNYGRGKVYETRQATNELTKSVWCDETISELGTQDSFTFHRNGTGRYAIWNSTAREYVEDQRLWWSLKGDSLSLNIADKFGEPRVETLRFRSTDNETVVVFLERTGEAERVLSKCELPKLKAR